MTYAVSIQPDAEVELDEIYAYAAHRLMAGLDAVRLISRLEEAILSLREMPYRAPLSRDPRFAIQGVRAMPVGNHMIYYIVDDVIRGVSVVHVAHHLRDSGSL